MTKKPFWEYYALTIFCKAGFREIRVFQVEARDLENALEVAVAEAERYATDFSYRLPNITNVYEAGNDMKDDYGEIFSLSCKPDGKFEKLFEKKLCSAMGVHSAHYQRPGTKKTNRK
jgi:hypothetical protein